MKLGAFVILCALCGSIQAQNMTTKRARDLGIPFEGTPGKYNAITDVPGVEVGFKTKLYVQ